MARRSVNGASVFFYVVATLKDRGLSVDEIESVLANTGDSGKI